MRVRGCIVIGVQQGQHVFGHRLGRVAHAGVVVQICTHVSLGELLLVAVLVQTHDLGDVHILGSLEAQVVEELEVLGQGGEPLLTADDQIGAHEVIVHGVGEVVGG